MSFSIANNNNAKCFDKKLFWCIIEHSMIKLYIVFALLYSVFNSFFDALKKKAVHKSSELSTLVIFTGVSFLCSLVWIPFGIGISGDKIWLFVLKGLLLTINWFVLLRVLKDADVSLVALTTVVSAVITFAVGIIGFGETATVIQYIGAGLTILGAVLINLTGKKENGKVNVKTIILLMISAIIGAVSAVIDKYTTQTLSAYQVQFWFLLFVFVFSCIFFAVECVKEKKFLIQKSDFKNYWIYIVGIALFLGDFFLFLSYTMTGSKMIIITTISKFKVVISVLIGILLYKEKNVVKKLLISLLVFAGILLVSL